MATRKEIAELAGVSQSTVSRLLNGDKSLKVKGQTRRRIMQAAAQLGYTAFTSRSIAVLNVPPHIDELQDAYFNSLREELNRAAEEQGTLVESFTSVDELVAIADDFDGFVAIGPASLDRTALAKLRDVLPYGVFIDTNPAPDWFDSVQPDLSQTMLDAIDALAGAGYQRIAFIGGVGSIMGLHDHVEDLRSLAFTEWSKRLGLRNDDLVYATGPFTVSNGKHLAQQLIDQHQSARTMPDALVVASDPMAVGVLQEFTDAGIRVPSDVAVVSVNNLPIAQYTAPPLSSFNIDQHELVYTALDTLRDAISRNRSVRRHVFISTSLVCRSSFAPRS